MWGGLYNLNIHSFVSGSRDAFFCCWELSTMFLLKELFHLYYSFMIFGSFPLLILSCLLINCKSLFNAHRSNPSTCVCPHIVQWMEIQAWESFLQQIFNDLFLLALSLHLLIYVKFVASVIFLEVFLLPKPKVIISVCCVTTVSGFLCFGFLSLRKE